MKKLSARQQAILDYIGAFLDENDYPPTIRDIQHELGISSTSVVDYNLKVLEERDLIRRNRNISRGIELVGRTPARTGTASIRTRSTTGTRSTRMWPRGPWATRRHAVKGLTTGNRGERHLNGALAPDRVVGSQGVRGCRSICVVRLGVGRSMAREPVAHVSRVSGRSRQRCSSCSSCST